MSPRETLIRLATEHPSLRAHLVPIITAIDANSGKVAEDPSVGHRLNVGDIFYSSWGYDQTNVDFYEVKEVSGKRIIIHLLEKKVIRTDGDGNTYMVPIPGRFDRSDQDLKKIPSFYNGKPIIKLTSYSSAQLWDGRPRFETSFAGGH
jgi:hypothetical protein